MSERRAVIIGVGKYLDEKIDELKGSICDASELRDRLVESQNFEVSDDHFLTGPNANCQAIRKAISDVLWKPDPCKLVLFYFSGHGFRDEYGNGYIAPYDMKPREPLVCGIRMQELTGLLLSAKNKTAVVVVLDCCYSGIAAQGARAAAEPLGDPGLKDWFSALDKETAGEGRIILASSRKDEKSREKEGCVHALGNQGPHVHGKFTFHLLEGLDGRAAEGDGRVTLDGLRRYIDEQMTNDPEHKMSWLGAGVTQAGQIVISRATQWYSINEALAVVRNLLREGGPWSVCGAARRLKAVLPLCPTLQAACDLNREIDMKLQQYGGMATEWLVRKMITIGVEYRDVFKRLQEIVANELSMNSFTAQDEAMQGLIISLFEITSENPQTQQPSRSEQTFVQQLRAQSAANRQRISVVKSQAPGSGDLS